MKIPISRSAPERTAPERAATGKNSAHSRSRLWRQNWPERGQLLLEVLLALALIAAAASMVTPRFFRDPPPADAKSAAGLARDVLREARERAATSGHRVWLAIDTRRAVVGGPVEDAPASRRQLVALRAETAQEAARDGQPGVIFFGDGGSTGTVLTFTDRRQACTLRVNWLSGGVDDTACTTR